MGKTNTKMKLNAHYLDKMIQILCFSRTYCVEAICSIYVRLRMKRYCNRADPPILSLKQMFNKL